MAIGFIREFSQAITACAALCLLALSPCGYGAEAISLNGVFGEKALISIGSGSAKVMAVGEMHQGIKLLGVQDQQVVIEVDGKRRTLKMGFGFSPANPGKATATVVINADARGQFFTAGSINGSGVRFLLDTGASVVTLPRSLALSAGVRLEDAELVMASTANGRSRAYRVLLNSVRVGGISAHMVEAIILEDAQLPVALLGMSFLQRTLLKQENGRLTLSQRY
jgi:aspartyl protease family protein